jgi:hypothetical protein
MPMASATLASGLSGMAPADTEADAIQAFVSAWDAYFAQSQVGAAVATPGSYAAGLAAMQGALAGCSVTGAAAAKLTAGVTAFWAAIATLAPTIWITAPIILVPPIVPPVGLAGISAALAAAFAANTTGSASLSDSANAAATAIHAANLGALVPGSAPPAPPAPIPIL